MVYSVRKIESIEDFRNLKSTWNQLVKDKTSYHPYMDHDWFELWLNHFKGRHDLLILIVKKDDSPKAICPLWIKKKKFKGIQANKIELIGNIYSPICNFIFARMDDTEKADILQTIIKYLQKSVNWDIIDLYPLPEENFDFNLFKHTVNEMGYKLNEYFCFGNWYLDNIDYSGNDYMQSRTSNIRNNIKRYGKKLQKMGNLEFVMVTSGSDEKIDHYMDLYYAVYHKSWKAPEMDPTFHRNLAKLARDRGWLRLGLLLFDTLPLASQFWLVSKRVAYIAKLAYDESYKKYRPGNILSSKMMKYVIDKDGVEQVDYLEGDEPYKKDWTPLRRERKGLTAFNHNLKGTTLAFLTLKVIPSIKKIEYFNKLKKRFFLR